MLRLPLEGTHCQKEFSFEKFLIKDRDEGLVLRLSLDIEIPLVSN